MHAVNPKWLLQQRTERFLSLFVTHLEIHVSIVKAKEASLPHAHRRERRELFDREAVENASVLLVGVSSAVSTQGKQEGRGRSLRLELGVGIYQLHSFQVDTLLWPVADS